MEIWLDTIDLAVINDAAKVGIIAGVTTNPSILSKATNVGKTLEKLLGLQQGPVAAQVTSSNAKDMIEEGRKIASYSERMIVKVPMNKEGLITIKQLVSENIPVLGTSILFPQQALLATVLGTSYISPYFSHMGDGETAIDLLRIMVEILKKSNGPTKMLAASLREVQHIINCALLGVEAVTIKPDLFEKLVSNHPSVEGFLLKFNSEWSMAFGQESICDLLTEDQTLTLNQLTKG